MNRYETFIISDPDISDEKRASLFERINQLLPKENGFMVAFDEWGIKKLAYEIKKRIRGHYVRLDYCGAGTLVNEIERFSRIDDRVLKYMTVLLEKEADIDRIKEEIAKAEAEQVTDLVEESETGPAAEPETDPAEESETDPVEESEKNQDDKSDSDPVLFDAPGSEAMEKEKVKTEKKDEEE